MTPTAILKGRPDQIKPHRFQARINPETLPQHWFADSAFLTHLLNTWTIMFPAGERYFVRWCKKALETIEDPKIRKDILGFIGQETQHANQHEKLWDVIRGQGYNIDPLMAVLDKFCFGFLESVVPDKWNYACVAALEHFTAMFGEIYFETPELMEQMHPEMRALFEWHAAEEIEHKAVAFDQLEAVENSYVLRTGLMNVSVVLLYAITFGNTFYMMWQDKSLFKWQEWLTVYEGLLGKHDVAKKTILKFFEYYKPGFHPWQNENYGLAQPTLAAYDKQAS
jgi:uncharacterized protein